MILNREHIELKRGLLTENVIAPLTDNWITAKLWHKCFFHYLNDPLRNQNYTGISMEIQNQIINEIIN